MISKSIQNRREQILNIAQHLFSKFGPGKTTIDDIAKNVRMGKASIYYYFTNKEAIYKEVVQKEGKMAQDRIMNAVNSRIGPQDKLLAYLLTRAECMKELVNYNDALKDEYRQYYMLIETTRQEFDNFELTLIQQILQQGVEENVFHDCDIEVISDAIHAVIKGFEYRWTFDVPLETIKKNTRVLLDLLLKGIEKRK